MQLRHKIKISSITRRWLLNVLLIVVLAVVVSELVVFALIRNIYADGVQSVAEEYIQPFETLALVSEAEFFEKANQMVQNFRYHDRIEVQIIDRNGALLLSTSGFAPSETTMPDYRLALRSNDGYGSWIGHSDTGETVFAGTKLLADFGTGSNGAVRYLFSMRAVNRRVILLFGIAVIIGLFVIVITAWSGVYFTSSIVRPLRQVTEATRRIAAGDPHIMVQASGGAEMIELCESINEMARELQNTENLKNDFISSVSHELRTPLTAIRGWSETMMTAMDQENSIVKHGSEIILGETDRLQGLVEELLDFSRMQCGKLTLNLARANIMEILENVTEMYKETARRQNVDLTYIQTEQSAWAMIDHDRIKQVFINVIDNAVKYSNAGGQVTVRAVTDGQSVRITVKDNGIGIRPKDLEHVKEKFYKANSNIRGSGIGLALADEIVKQHGGLLLIESEEGVGTVVTVVLALLKEEKNESGK